MKWMFSTIIGLFITDENYTLVEHIPFKTLPEYTNREKQEQVALKKHKDLKKASTDQLPHILSLLKEKEYLKLLKEQNTILTINAVRASVNSDVLINQATNNINECDKTSSILVKRLREWYELYLPEFSHSIKNNEGFVRFLREKNRKELLSELKLTEEETMGTGLKKEDLNEIMLLAELVQHIYTLRGHHEAYLQSILKDYAPNMNELCGTTIAAKLLEHAGSLKRLALLPSSTLQLLGAEKALFRHLTRKSKPPKYGLIINHPIIQNARKTDKGKAARALADKISICARLDYFKGEFKALEFKKELEERFK